jgi:hypothetical protein
MSSLIVGDPLQALAILAHIVAGDAPERDYTWGAGRCITAGAAQPAAQQAQVCTFSRRIFACPQVSVASPIVESSGSNSRHGASMCNKAKSRYFLLPMLAGVGFRRVMPGSGARGAIQPRIVAKVY